MASSTHKHRNIIDDILDLGLLIGGLLYFLFGHKIGLAFTDKELAAIASTGATARILVRKILMRIWRDSLDSLPGETAPVTPPSETPTAAPETAEPEDEPDTPDEPVIPPPPTVGSP